MKRCPKCNRTYSTDTQKFCTHDGGLLFAEPDDLGQTVKFDSSKVRDAVPKPTTRDLPAEHAAAFDPEATVVSRGVSDGTQQVKSRDTGDLHPPTQTRYYGAPPPSVQPTGPVSPPPAPPPAAPPPPTSAPLSPPQTSAPLPPTEVVSSTPTAAPSIPMPAPPAAAAAQVSQPLPPAAPGKKSKLPIILGLLAVLIIFFVGAAAVAGYFLWWKPRQEAQARERVVITEEPSQPSSSLPGTTASPGEASVPSNEPPPYNPPADAVQFVNSESDLSGRLAENFVAFSFYYPNRWVKVPSAENFIMVERRLPPDFTQENFAVAPWFSTDETTTFDDAFFQKLVAKDDANFAKKFPGYKKVSEGPVKVGAYDAYELRFEGLSRGTDKGDLNLWGREIFFAPRAEEKTGVKFLILTTSLAPELKSIDDVGTKGELPMLLESFRFGK